MASEAYKMDLSINEFEKRFGVIGKQPAKCEQHGDFIQVLRRDHEPSGCPVCAEAKREEEQYQLRLEAFVGRHMPRAGIPRRFAGKSFDTYESKNAKQRRALEICCNYVDDFRNHAKAGRCLLLLGNVGTGKTHLACAIADFLIRHRMVSAMYRTVGDIMVTIRSTYDGGEGSEHDILRELSGCGLLVLDEVGATKPTEFEHATLFKIINARYERCLPTIVISNLGATDLSTALGERCVDRLRENGGIAVSFDWASKRGERA
ncbi:hypothetical protein HMPREF1487_04369 [Pseudomonas sp. HPB0071]|uniref:ATP-binding protein n=1 Tax=unclassified Pseudomonas TaxID=196821 RepID=UPI0002CC5791|nr:MULTISPECIES: ATP-binding protein [unclassified Pseudomonas]ENA37451.1 hypothetical protein HMPREF1487_04369 [Pseudomonas sp. HPB0071]